MDALLTNYFEWLREKACGGDTYRLAYFNTVFEELFNTEYQYIIPADDNRYQDGLALRWHCSDETGMEEIGSDERYCSVLEMMVALCQRICYEVEDATISEWFWLMMHNLGLSEMDDGRFDPVEFRKIMAVFMSGSYDKTGKGGLFVVKKPERPMYDIELWYQFNIYLHQFHENLV